MSILVTGGAGYIGTQTVRALLDAGESVVIVDRKPVAPRSPIAHVPCVVMDVAQTSRLIDVIAEHHVDRVIHFAADKSVAESTREPGRYMRNNVGGSLSVLEAMVATGVQSIVFSSSCSVYGTPARLPVDERAPVQPESPYGATKVMTEQLLHWFGVAHGVRWVSLRYFNAAGASSDGRSGEDWERTTMLIPGLIKATLNARAPLDIYGTDHPTPDGTAIRDFIHVADLADAHLRSLKYLASGGVSDVFNVGTGEGTSVGDVIEMVARVSGRVVPVRYVGRRDGDPSAVWADATKAASILGWTAAFHIESIVETAWRWHSSSSLGLLDP